MMKYDEFVVHVKEVLEEKLKNEHAEIMLRTVTKANDFRREGLAIRAEGRHAAPTIYLDEFYEYYQKGAEIRDIIEVILGIYEKNKNHFSDEMLDFTDFEKARDHITCRLLNTEINREYLQGVPHVDCLDLSLVFYCTLIGEEDGQILSGKITDALMEEWGIDLKTLGRIAEKNTLRMMGTMLCSLKDVILEYYDLSREDNRDLLEELSRDDQIPIYVLTNDPGNYGAANILLGHTLSDLSDLLGKDLYIIPSSVHEVLVVPAGAGIDQDMINDMVREVNEDILEPQEVLSDHAYIYSREKHQLMM